ncbi:uncharacterized protein PAC_17471 [Phialocephala subalpina]|uniref:Uncharacterized protein n=1 Tax=Phialocephala subalpina TaxID=576137 RepID=A0A1L7XR86_9HELO|nr:uncharacterized protein PAC_17471 [Phialocephala subalpina]
MIIEEIWAEAVEDDPTDRLGAACRLMPWLRSMRFLSQQLNEVLLPFLYRTVEFSSHNYMSDAFTDTLTDPDTPHFKQNVTQYAQLLEVTKTSRRFDHAKISRLIPEFRDLPEFLWKRTRPLEKSCGQIAPAYLGALLHPDQTTLECCCIYASDNELFVEKIKPLHQVHQNTYKTPTTSESTINRTQLLEKF